ncbi:MAG: ferrochelatase [Candidatus Micrarchaeaceae archaeon]
MGKDAPYNAFALMSYGAPRSVDDVEAYLRGIRHGIPAEKSEVESLAARYAAIGGTSPIISITARLAVATEYKLYSEEGIDSWVFIGMKHSYPKIEDMAKRIRAFGSIKKLTSLVLAPHFSSAGAGEYGEKLAEYMDGIETEVVRSWYNVAGFPDMWASRISKVMQNNEDTLVIFTAHGLPKEKMREDDRYVEQVEESAEAIASKANISEYEVAFQGSSGRHGWLEPTLESKIEENKEAYAAFLIAPIGYVTDNLEILYDLDIEIKKLCTKLGKGYYRPEMPNDSQELASIIAHVLAEKSA